MQNLQIRYGEMSDRESLYRESVQSKNCLVRYMSVGEVSIGEMSVGDLSLEKCQSGDCPVGKLSYNLYVKLVISHYHTFFLRAQNLKLFEKKNNFFQITHTMILTDQCKISDVYINYNNYVIS